MPDNTNADRQRRFRERRDKRLKELEGRIDFAGMTPSEIAAAIISRYDIVDLRKFVDRLDAHLKSRKS